MRLLRAWVACLIVSHVAAQYGPPQTKGKKHRTTTTTTETPGVISNEINGPFPVTDTATAYSFAGSSATVSNGGQTANSFWWAGPDSPFKPGAQSAGSPPPPNFPAPPPPAPPVNGCGGPAGCTGLGMDPRPSPSDSVNKPVDIAQNPFLSSAILGKPIQPSPQGCQTPGGGCQYPSGASTSGYPGAPNSPGQFPEQPYQPSSQYPGSPQSPNFPGNPPTPGTPSRPLYPQPTGSNQFPGQAQPIGQYPGSQPTGPNQYPGQHTGPIHYPAQPQPTGPNHHPGQPSPTGPSQVPGEHEPSGQYPGQSQPTPQYPGPQPTGPNQYPGQPWPSGPNQHPGQPTSPNQYPGQSQPTGQYPGSQSTGPNQYPGQPKPNGQYPGKPQPTSQYPGPQPTGPNQYPGQPQPTSQYPGPQPTGPNQYPGQPQPTAPNQYPGQPRPQPNVPLRPQCGLAGHACVPSSSCIGGVISSIGMRQMRDPEVKECIPGLEACCRIPSQPNVPYSQKPDYSATTPRPYTGPLNTTPYPGCAAALKCVAESFCTAEGVMSDTPVILTKEQAANKVPTTDCQDLETGLIGKCCRDPNYKDPWPAGMMMMKNPGDFDDGQYHGEGSGPGGNVGPSYNAISTTPHSPAKDHGPKPSIPSGGFNKPFPPPFPGNTPYSPQQPASPYQPASPSSYPKPPGPPPQPIQPTGISYQPNQPTQTGPHQPGQPFGAPQQPTIGLQPPQQSFNQPRQPAGAPYQPTHPSSSPFQPPTSSYQPGQPGPSENILPPSETYQPGQPIPSETTQPEQPGQQPDYNLPTHPGQNQAAGPEPGSSCGVRRPKGPGGDAAGFAEFPWQALVMSAGNRSLLCGAAIIADNAVITAAHCVNQLRASDILVKAGEWKLLSQNPKPVQVRPVTTIARHPAYDSGSLAKDLAILLVAEPFTFDVHVDKICVPPELGSEYFQKPGQNCVITGWGKNALQGPVQDSELHKVDVNVVPAKQCEAKLKTSQNLGKYFILNEGFSCALPPSPSDLCKVDFGSAVACEQGDGHYELAGVNSWDIACPTGQPLPTVFATSDAQWINLVLNTPLSVLQAEENNYNQGLHKGEDLGGVDVDDKPGFSQGYGK